MVPPPRRRGEGSGATGCPRAPLERSPFRAANPLAHSVRSPGPCRPASHRIHRGTNAMADRPIRAGVITDTTGPLSFLGLVNANMARMVIDDINAAGGLLGRRIELWLEDSATTDSVAEAKAAKLVQQDRVDVLFGGIYSSTRQAIK